MEVIARSGIDPLPTFVNATQTAYQADVRRT